MSARRQALTSVPLLAAALALGGCGASGRAEPPPGSGAAVAADGRALAATTSASQAEMLRDGRVTFAEYAAATRATVRCMRAGPPQLRVERPQPAPGGELHFGWSIAARSGAEMARLERLAERRFERCHAEHEDDVKLIYANQRVVPRDRRPAVLAELVACLRAAGVRIGDAPSVVDLGRAVHAEEHAVAGRRREGGQRCADRFADFFRVPAPVSAAARLGATAR